MNDAREDKCRFVEAGLFDSQALAKALPVTAQGLRDGTKNPGQEAVKMVINAFWYLPKKDNPDEKRDGHYNIFNNLTEAVIPSWSAADLVHPHLEPHPLTLDLYRNYSTIQFTVDELKENGICATCVGNIQQAFDKTVERWESRIRDSTGPPLEKTCQLYKVSSEHFFAFVMEKLSEEFDTSQLHDTDFLASLMKKKKYIALAADGVVKGADRIEITCWECGAFHGNVQRCSQCRAARYCSRECQAKSWKGGHKKICKELKAAYDRFTDDLQVIERTSSQDGTEATPKANPFIDYLWLAQLWERWADEDELVAGFKSLGCPEPSIATLHRNLQVIAQGETHPLFADDVGTQEASDDPIAESEIPAVSLAGRLLCFDASKLSLSPQERNEFFWPFRECMVFDDGGTLTAKRFLRLYETMDNFLEPFDEERDPRGARFECHAQVLKILKDKFNQSE